MPQAVADDRALGEAFARIAGIEDAPQLRIGVEQREEICAYGIGFDAPRLLAAGDVGVDRPNRRDVIEDAGVQLHVLEFRLRDANVDEIEPGHVHFDGDQLVGMGERERPEQDGIDHGEQRRVRAHSPAPA